MVASAKKTFFAGGDLRSMIAVRKDDAADVFALCEAVKAGLRRLETYPRPVVAAINGAALGGGFEIALAANHRIALDDPTVELGLPEASLGLLPGGGGVTRIVRMLGIQDGLMEVLLQGTRFKPAAAQEKGLVDELVGSLDDLLPAAKAWILEHRDDDAAAKNPWDRPGYKMPGGTPKTPALAAFLPAFPALLRKQTKGAVYPAQRAILSAAVEGAATRLRHRVADRVALPDQPDRQPAVEEHDPGVLLRPAGDQRRQAPPPGRPAVQGHQGRRARRRDDGRRHRLLLRPRGHGGRAQGRRAGRTPRRARPTRESLLDKAIARGRSTEEKKAELLGRITATADPADLTGCDLVIEAVFEDPSLKHQVFGEIAAYVNDDALLCSNTSTLPITELATGVDRPADFIGLHFFSPVDKMPLVEIIKGEKTSDEALAKAYDVVQQIRKTPIVVNDSRGFYTSRVIGTMVNEGLAMLAEGVHPMSLERAATQAGYPVGPLQLTDELNMELMAKIGKANRDAVERDGRPLRRAPGRGRRGAG